ncbi:MAG: hypothetical protein ACYCWE_07150 [Eubacteriales bacterium]
MKKRLTGLDITVIAVIVLLLLISVKGLLSFRTDNSYFITNQYGDEVKIFGSGIYAHDSCFKAPILIGSDFTMLFLVVPLLITALINQVKNRTQKSGLFQSAVLAAVLYYAVSITFGVTYNSFLLIYIALFACSFFAFISSVRKINLAGLQKTVTWVLPSGSVSVFLILTGIALFAAWLPDIIPTIISGTTLSLIEVYTTEITYGLDMGIISPMMFVCLYLLKRKDGLGIVLLAVIFTLCAVMGAMLPLQTVYQTLAEIETPVPVLVIKVGIFVVLAAFAVYFDLKLFRSIKEK